MALDPTILFPAALIGFETRHRRVEGLISTVRAAHRQALRAGRTQRLWTAEERARKSAAMKRWWAEWRRQRARRRR